MADGRVGGPEAKPPTATRGALAVACPPVPPLVLPASAEQELHLGMVGGWNISAAAAPGGDAIARACVSRVRSYVPSAIVWYVYSLSHVWILLGSAAVLA
eukprot:6194481-Pleurochrysis_carterae.AAC.3